MPVRWAVAGRTDSTELVQVEAMLTHMEMNLDSFKKHVISVPSDDWDRWLEKECEKRLWKHTGEVVVFRELVDRGGASLYVGGLDELYEYAKNYYDMDPVVVPDDEVMAIVAENVSEEARWKKIREAERVARWQPPVVVCITSVSSDAAHYVLESLMWDGVFPPGQELGVILLAHSKADLEIAQDIVRDMEDCAARHLQFAEISLTPKDAFKNADYVIILDQLRTTASGVDGNSGDIAEEAAAPAEEGENEKGTNYPVHQEANHAQVNTHIDSMTKYADCIKVDGKSSVKVIVAGRHATAVVGAISKVFEDGHDNGGTRQVVTMASLREQRAKNILSKKLNVRPQNVVDVVCWGDLDQPCCVWVSRLGAAYCHVGGISGPETYKKSVDEVTPLAEMFLTSTVPRKVQEHSQQGDSAVATGKAVADVLKPYLWWPKETAGKNRGSFTTVGLVSQGQYGVPAETAFGFPAVFNMETGMWKIEDSLSLDAETQTAIMACTLTAKEEESKT